MLSSQQPIKRCHVSTGESHQKVFCEWLNAVMNVWSIFKTCTGKYQCQPVSWEWYRPTCKTTRACKNHQQMSLQRKTGNLFINLSWSTRSRSFEGSPLCRPAIHAAVEFSLTLQGGQKQAAQQPGAGWMGAGHVSKEAQAPPTNLSAEVQPSLALTTPAQKMLGRDPERQRITALEAGPSPHTPLQAAAQPGPVEVSIREPTVGGSDAGPAEASPRGPALNALDAYLKGGASLLSLLLTLSSSGCMKLTPVCSFI